MEEDPPELAAVMWECRQGICTALQICFLHKRAMGCTTHMCYVESYDLGVSCGALTPSRCSHHPLVVHPHPSNI